MAMASFQMMSPEVARKETRSVHVLRPDTYNIPVDEYGFLESYCDDKGCDCRRVLISVFGVNQGKVLASISLGFDSGKAAAGPFIDPLAPQSTHSRDLLRLFTDVINEDPDYLARLQRHYAQYKEKIDGRPYQGRPFEDPHSVKRTSSSPQDMIRDGNPLPPTQFEPVVRRGRKVGRNDPCPCGSGKKYKKCCLSKPKDATGTGPGPENRGTGGLREAKDLVDRVVAARKTDQHRGIERPVQEALENRPDLAFRFLGLLLNVYAPDGREWEPAPGYYACLDLLEENLTLVRYSVERERAWAIDLSRQIQAEIASQAFTPEVDVRVQSDLLVALRESRLKLEPAIRKQSAKVGEYYGKFGDRDAKRNVDRLLKTLVRDGRGDPFKIRELLMPYLDTQPAENQFQTIAVMAAADHPRILEAAWLMLLHPLPEVRNELAQLTSVFAGTDSISPFTLRRMIGLRNWLPQAEQDRLDTGIKKARAASTECARNPPRQSMDGYATTFDGSGVQGVWLISRHRHPYTVVAIMVKQGEGIRDVYIHKDLTEQDVNAMLKDFSRTAATEPVSKAYLDRLIPHFLWVGQRENHPPPPELLQAAEVLGEYWMPAPLVYSEEIAKLEEAANRRIQDPGVVAAVLADSAAWPGRMRFAESWFEDDARVDALLHEHVGPHSRWQANMDRASSMLLERVLEDIRQAWCDRLVWMTLWARDSQDKSNRRWEEFLILARELHRGRPLKEIPLMRAVAERSVQSALRRALARPQLNEKP